MENKYPELKIANCCGNCKHVSRPKQPSETHEAYYNVAKTERWCYLHNWHITRETVCDDFELEPKKGGASACKRVFAFNKKVETITALRERMKNGNVPYAYRKDNIRRYSIDDERPYIKIDRLVKKDGESYYEHLWSVGPKDGDTNDYIKEIEEYLDCIGK